MPNGRHRATAVRNPAAPGREDAQRMAVVADPRVARARGLVGGASTAPPRDRATGHSARRIVTTATSGTRIPSCGLTIAAMTVKIAARSGWSRHSERRPSSRKTTPTESTWPHTTLSNQKTGLTIDHGRGEEGQALATAELADHRPDEVADGQVGQDRRHLDQVADAADGVPDRPDEPQHVQVAGRVVVEEVALVEARDARRWRDSTAQNRKDDRSASNPDAGQQVCQNETEGESEREDDQDRADGPLRPGRPSRRSRASLVPTGNGASHRGNGSCTSVEGGSERSTGPAGGLRPVTRGWTCRLTARDGWPSWPACCWRSPRSRSTSRPRPTASTTTSCGRPRPSSRARRRSAIRSR